MIPKIIHYCYFGGGEFSELTKKCIESWKKACPDYKIVFWNEENFDVHCNSYISALYSEKKYAHVSDYARLKIVYENGGIYLDTDVELLKTLDDFLDCEAFFGMQKGGEVATGLGFGGEKGAKILKELMNNYERKSLHGGKKVITKTCVDTDKKIFKAMGLRSKNILQRFGNVVVYPSEYFNPKDFETDRLELTENTVSIHYYDSSWHDECEKIINQKYKDFLNKYDRDEAKERFGKWYRRNRLRLLLKRYGIGGLIKNWAQNF